MMCCPRCSSCYIRYDMVSDGMKTKTSEVSLARKIGRAFMVLCTCGLWLFVPKKKSSSKTYISTRKIAICQSCGYSWEVK